MMLYILSVVQFPFCMIDLEYFVTKKEFVSQRIQHVVESYLYHSKDLITALLEALLLSSYFIATYLVKPSQTSQAFQET